MTDASNVRVGVTGAVYVGDTGGSLPEDATEPVGPSYDDVGYLGEEGVVEAHDADTEEVQAWQNGDIVRVLQTSHNVTFTFTMLETTDVSLREFYGDYDDGVIEITGRQLPRRSWIITVLDDEHVLRIVIPDGQVTERGDVEYVGTDATSREITVTAYPDSDGVKAFIYMDDASS